MGDYVMYQQQIIGQNAPMAFNPLLNPIEQARTTGQVVEYQFMAIKPKKKEKELIKVLLPEPKSFLFFRFGKKFNLKDRCVVCGMHHLWESGDFLRPPIPLERVTKGRPLRGTYCPKHSAMFKQLEMLEQQILAEKHGLDFKAFKPRMPKALSGKPLTHLSKNDVASLTAAGYFIKPPTLQDNRSATNEAIEIVGQINILADRLNYLMIQGEVKAKEVEETEE
jgi:hypothetical protein